MKPLPVTPPLHHGQTTISFCSNLAAANGISTRREFCQHMGLAFNDLLQGEENCLSKLAILGNADFERLQKGTLLKYDRYFNIGCQVLSKAHIRYQHRLYICPVCITQDLQNGTGPQWSRPYLRNTWLTNAVQACPLHNVAIVECAASLSPYIRSDLPVVLRNYPSEYETLYKNAETMKPSGFEAYIHDRLNGCKNSTYTLLDSMPLHVAIDLTEIIGAQQLFGRNVLAGGLSPNQRRMAYDHGFSCTQYGKLGLIEHLSYLTNKFNDRDHRIGFGRLYAKIYHWLRFNLDNPDFEIPLAQVREHAISNLPLGPGDDFLGPVTSRKVHSLRTASEEYGLTQKSIRDAAAKNQWITNECAHLPNDKIRFDADLATPKLMHLSQFKDSEEARKYTGVPVRIWQELLNENILMPVSNPMNDGNVDQIFLTSDLDKFVQCLTQQKRTDEPHSGLTLPISAASKNINIPIIDTVKLILNGKLKYIGCRKRYPPFTSVLVNLSELRSHLPVQ